MLLNGKKIVSSGRNKPGVTNKYFKHKWNLRDTHAEVDALIHSNRQPADSILVVRIHKSGRLMNSRPCLSCQAILRHFGINKVYYSDKKGEISIMRLDDE